MANQSPAVITNESIRDLVVQQASSITGATVGVFAWGEADKPILVGDPANLINQFGAPTDSNFVDVLCAANYLSYTGALYVTRVLPDNDTAFNAGIGVDTSDNLVFADNSDYREAPLFAKNLEAFDELVIDEAERSGSVLFMARCAGERGNNIEVRLVSKGVFDGSVSVVQDFDLQNAFPRNLLDDELGLLVLENGSIVETFIGSRIAGTKTASGANDFIIDKVNRTSSLLFMFAVDDIFEDSAINNPVNVQSRLFEGTSGSFTTPAEEDSARIFGWDLYADSDQIEVDNLFLSGGSATVGQYVADNIVSVRQDCVGFASPQFEDLVGITNPDTILNNVIAARNNFSSNSYMVMDGNYKYQFDPYNDVFRWLPLNADIAGLHAQSENNTAAWFAAGGFNRGHVNNVRKLAWQPNKTFRDSLYRNEINPVVTFSGDGTVFLGNKTLLTSTSAFGSINVRKLFNVLKRSISKMARFQLFEFNDRQTQLAFTQAVVPFLRSVQGQRGITEFRVVADATVNTPQVVNNSEFVGDIYIIPARAIELIRLNFVSVAAGVSFEEIITLNEGA